MASAWLPPKMLTKALCWNSSTLNKTFPIKLITLARLSSYEKPHMSRALTEVITSRYPVQSLCDTPHTDTLKLVAMLQCQLGFCSSKQQLLIYLHPYTLTVLYICALSQLSRLPLCSPPSPPPTFLFHCLLPLQFCLLATPFCCWLRQDMLPALRR